MDPTRQPVSVIPDQYEASDGASMRRVVHDLRSALNAMRLAVDLLRRSLERDDAGGEAFRAEQLRQIERLDRQIAAMTDLLANAIRALDARAKDVAT